MESISRLRLRGHPRSVPLFRRGLHLLVRPMGIPWYRLLGTSPRGTTELICRVKHQQSDTPFKVITIGRIKEIPTWFPGAKLNFAENLLLRQHDAIAYTSIRETGSITHYTFRETRRLVEEMAAALRVNGLRIGDRVAGMHRHRSINSS